MSISIAGNTIKLRDNATLNYQLLNQVVASVTVQDLSGATVTSNLTVNIDNVNEPPVFSSNLYFGEVDDGTVNTLFLCFDITPKTLT